MDNTYKAFSTELLFDALIECASSCNLCERMSGRPKVLSDKNGNIKSKVLFVAEAPGRLGADKTGIPLYGDKAGNNFEQLLANIGWSRDSVFITNAILCNPRAINGNNATPTDSEIRNCSELLQMTINLIKPDIIVALGGIALKALNNIRPHKFSLHNNVRQISLWNGYRLFIAYHPGQRAVIHRSLNNQRADFYELSKYVDPIKGLKQRKKHKVKISFSSTKKLQSLISAIDFTVQHLGKLSKFKLTKLLYLADLRAIESTGKGITGAIYLRQVDGPWPPDLDKALKHINGSEIIMEYRGKIPYICAGPNPSFISTLDKDNVSILLDTFKRYGSYSNGRIKSAVYKTQPMKKIIDKEKRGENLLNKPVF